MATIVTIPSGGEYRMKMMKKPVTGFVVLCALLWLHPVVARAADSGYKGYSRGHALITVHELKRLIDAGQPKLVILAAQSNEEYGSGHIPGSYQIDRPVCEAPKETQNGVSGNLIDADGFTRLAGRLGIDTDSNVVVYDTKYDATRIWWAFLYYGKGDVRVLDGGIRAWKAAGYPVDMLVPRDRYGNFVARIANPRLRVDTPEIAALHDNGAAQLWDIRDWKEFTGEEQKQGSVRAGRIPGSRRCNWTDFKKKDNPSEWIDAGELQSALKRCGFDRGKEHYFYCLSGVRSTQGIFALYLAGWHLEKLHNYDSSWIGWSRDSSLPIESGPASPGIVSSERR
jgi:thiosulfate/3-mercaptopyruvate sulfurtransferase